MQSVTEKMLMQFKIQAERTLRLLLTEKHIPKEKLQVKHLYKKQNLSQKQTM